MPADTHDLRRTSSALFANAMIKQSWLKSSRSQTSGNLAPVQDWRFQIEEYDIGVPSGSQSESRGAIRCSMGTMARVPHLPEEHVGRVLLGIDNQDSQDSRTGPDAIALTTCVRVDAGFRITCLPWKSSDRARSTVGSSLILSVAMFTILQVVNWGLKSS